MSSYQLLFDFIHQYYNNDDLVPLHAPSFDDTEKQYLNDCIDSNFVSSVGKYVEEFEQQVANFTGAKYAVAVVNGTMGLFLALKTLGVKENNLVITQSLTFVATANAISMLGAKPIFIDVSKSSLGLCPQKLAEFLANETYQQDGKCYHQQTNQKITACMPMHTLGFAVEIDEVVRVCSEYNIAIVEDAAESLGSFYQNKHTGTFGDFGVFSFNGNKILTTGGGGVLITDNKQLAQQAKHLSTTAKVPHQWLFEHDDIGYNLRMPNLNAALGVAQMQKLPNFIKQKRVLADKYSQLTQKIKGGGVFVSKHDQQPNNWLNALVFSNLAERNSFLDEANNAKIQARPLWTPMHKLDIYKNEIKTTMQNTEWFADRLVNIPSGVV